MPHCRMSDTISHVTLNTIHDVVEFGACLLYEAMLKTIDLQRLHDGTHKIVKDEHVKYKLRNLHSIKSMKIDESHVFYELSNLPTTTRTSSSLIYHDSYKGRWGEGDFLALVYTIKRKVEHNRLQELENGTSSRTS